MEAQRAIRNTEHIFEWPNPNPDPGPNPNPDPDPTPNPNPDPNTQTVLTCYADQSASSSCGVAMLCAKARVRP